MDWYDFIGRHRPVLRKLRVNLGAFAFVVHVWKRPSVPWLPNLAPRQRRSHPSQKTRRMGHPRRSGVGESKRLRLGHPPYVANSPLTLFDPLGLCSYSVTYSNGSIFYYTDNLPCGPPPAGCQYVTNEQG